VLAFLARFTISGQHEDPMLSCCPLPAPHSRSPEWRSHPGCVGSPWRAVECKI